MTAVSEVNETSEAVPGGRRASLVLRTALASMALGLSACNGWNVSALHRLSPAPPPTRTPFIYTPTARFLTPTVIALTLTPPSATETSTPLPTFTEVASSPTPIIRVEAVVLGCNTSLDLAHGLGEVTNVFLLIDNTGQLDLDNVCATLRALDEGRVHPDKTKCLPSLPAGYRATLKLTVDTTYRKETPVQIEVTSTLGLLQRVGREACVETGVPLPASDLGTPRPIPTP